MFLSRVRRVALGLSTMMGALLVALSPALAHTTQKIVGTPGNDVLRGSESADTITGLAGNDRIFGKSGNDRLFGDPGNDRLFGGPGNDRITGGSGTDRIACGTGNDVVFGDTGDAIQADCEILRIATPPPPPVLCQGRPATIIGTAGADRLTGTPDSDTIAGLGGNDVVEGLEGDDVLCGDEGNDRIDGGQGSDTIDSGMGSDTCINGEGGELCSAPPVLDIQGGVSEFDQTLIRDSTALNRSVYLQLLNVAIDGITIYADASNGGVYAGGGRISMTTGGAWWQQRDRASRLQVIAHEHFHLMQEGLSRYAWREPNWLREGSAEFISYFAIAKAGLIDFAAAKAQRVVWAKGTSAPLVTCVETAPNLEEKQRCRYSLGFIAVDFLISRYGSPPALVHFYTLLGNGLSWQDAFQLAFGTDVTTFYAEFETYRNTL